MRFRIRIWEGLEDKVSKSNHSTYLNGLSSKQNPRSTTFDIDDYITIAKSQLTPQRFENSVGVMQVMGDLAAIYNLDETAALTAGILHDIAKEFTPEDLLQWADENNIALRSEYDKIPLFLHGPIGASYLVQKLGMKDSTILDAISRHSYFGGGVPPSRSFCWCLRLADLLEPSRNWEDLKTELKPFVYSGKLGESAYRLMRWIIPFHESMSLPVHPNMHRVARELSTLRAQANLDGINHLPI
jgi:predicted HD superfamily hydrolase involved in NAD metabolism